MDLSTALEMATDQGWDTHKWTRRNITHQVSTERDGMLAFVTVTADGDISWSVSTHPDSTEQVRPRRGTATSVDTALAACYDTISECRGTLF